VANLQRSNHTLIAGKGRWHWPTSWRQLREAFAVVVLAALAAALAGWGPGFAAQPGQAQGKEKKPLALEDLLQRFDLLSPAARLQLVDKIAKADKEFQPASRGDVVLTVVARGSVESVDNGDIYCKVQSRTKGSTIASTIKSVVDDGTKVKKGDILVVLDDSGFQEQLKEKMQDCQRTNADKTTAEAVLALQKLQSRADDLGSEIAIRDAKLNLKKYAGKDPEEKEILKRMALLIVPIKVRASPAAQRSHFGVGNLQ
jgi:multidrug efflux pump subunit AcrA (membrane-fusion protein)